LKKVGNVSDVIRDAVIARIVNYALALDFATLPAAVVHEVKRRLIDTMGCVIAGFDQAPSRIARTLAFRPGTECGAACVLGTAERSLPELACFANGVAARALDGNDTFPGGGGHPSGVIAAVLAAAQAANAQAGADRITGVCTDANARTVVAAIVLGYDVHYRLWQACQVIRKGFDHAFYAGLAAAAGAAKVLRLERNAFANALSLAITPGLPFAVTRRGELSMWKGCAEAHAAQNGLFAALMAQHGMGAPTLPVEGAMGLAEMFGPLTLAPFPHEGGTHAILRADMKHYITEYHSQGPIAAALELRRSINLDEIAAITIHTYEFAHREIGSGPEKWRPKTRETADHSMPYIVAAALHDGAFSDAVFAPERLTDPKVLAIADRIAVIRDAEIDDDYPEKLRCRIDLTLRDGSRRSAGVDYPHGHHLDPMSDAEVEAKFRELASRKLNKERVEAALITLWDFEKLWSPDALFPALEIKRSEP
jgi:2-methylcitrate dehydratase